MATVTPKQLGQVQLGAVNTTVYTVPATTTGVIRTITVANTDEALERVFRLYLVPNGGSPGPATALFPKQSIAPTQVIEDLGVHVLPAGGTVVGSADVGSVITVTVDGAEVA